MSTIKDARGVANVLIRYIQPPGHRTTRDVALRAGARTILELQIENSKLHSKLRSIRSIIDHVDERCMALDVEGPITPTQDEITGRELRAIYRFAQVKL